jgi:hypothetical protein
MRSPVISGLLTLAAPPSRRRSSAGPPTRRRCRGGEAWLPAARADSVRGELYYPAGAAIFFNGNSMVRTGHYNGVPLYADATRDPYSVVYVPIGRGQLQPYERLRRGDLAGTTGTTSPSFPVRPAPDGPIVPMAAGRPTNLPLSVGAISAFTPEVTPPSCTPPRAPPRPARATSRRRRWRPWRRRRRCRADAVRRSASAGPTTTTGSGSLRRRDVGASGAAEPRTSASSQVGEHAGFPVFRKPGGGDIYLETRDGVLAPYRRKS